MAATIGRATRKGKHMDFDYRLDIAEVVRVIDTADVVAIYFPLLRKTLLIDTRSTAVDGPMIKVVPMVQTPEDRLKSLRQLRPRFPRPDSITIVPWPKYVGSLEKLGIWDHIVGRFVHVGSPEIVRQCEAALEELRTLEQGEISAAVRGENYKSLWEAGGGGSIEAEDEDEEEDSGEGDEEDEGM